MDSKEIEELADIIVGKITMPGHAFARDVCPGESTYACPASNAYLLCNLPFDCSVAYKPATDVKEECSASDAVQCLPAVSCASIYAEY